MGVAARLSSIELANESRGNQRRTLHLEVAASLPGQAAATAVIHNLSTDGLLLETSVAVAVQDVVELDLPNAGTRTAEVVWAKDGFYGCKFNVEVRPGDISAALLRASFETSPAFPSATTPTRPWSPRARTMLILGLALAAWAAVAQIASLLSN